MNLLRSPEELERDYEERLRNLPHDTHATISSSVELPEEYKGKEFRLQQEAHMIYWQIQALRGDPRVVMYHPV